MNPKFTAADWEKSGRQALVAVVELLESVMMKISTLPLSCGGQHRLVSDVECMRVRASCLVEGVKRLLEENLGDQGRPRQGAIGVRP